MKVIAKCALMRQRYHLSYLAFSGSSFRTTLYRDKLQSNVDPFDTPSVANRKLISVHARLDLSAVYTSSDQFDMF